MLSDVLNRYGYYLRVDVDEDIRAKRISDSNPVDVSYPDATKILNFTLDDSYASTINRVIVTARSRRRSRSSSRGEDSWPQRPGGLQYGTGGPIVPYSEDLSRRCPLSPAPGP
jgi:hypothetical protein